MSKEQLTILNIKIEEIQEKLDISIETSRLVIRSIEEKDFNDHKNLLADPITMKKYAGGVAITDENQIRNGFNTMLERWQNKDPFSRFLYF